MNKHHKTPDHHQMAALARRKSTSGIYSHADTDAYADTVELLQIIGAAFAILAAIALFVSFILAVWAGATLAAFTPFFAILGIAVGGIVVVGVTLSIMTAIKNKPLEPIKSSTLSKNIEEPTKVIEDISKQFTPEQAELLALSSIKLIDLYVTENHALHISLIKGSCQAFENALTKYSAFGNEKMLASITEVIIGKLANPHNDYPKIIPEGFRLLKRQLNSIYNLFAEGNFPKIAKIVKDYVKVTHSQDSDNLQSEVNQLNPVLEEGQNTKFTDMSPQRGKAPYNM